MPFCHCSTPLGPVSSLPDHTLHCSVYRRRPGRVLPCASRCAATKTPSSSIHSSPATAKPADPELVVKLPAQREEVSANPEVQQLENHEVFYRKMRAEIERQSAELVVLTAQVRRGLDNQPRHTHVAVSTDSLLTHVHAALATDPLPSKVHVAVATDPLLRHFHVAEATDSLQVHAVVATDPLPSRAHVAVETDPPPRHTHVAASTDPLLIQAHAMVSFGPFSDRAHVAGGNRFTATSHPSVRATVV
ncbi:uncharacterized protein LOC133512865 [Syngnathoides biaculeatus]|uniref:uncharacterized protein LOC133512865 n=1 Tax=Syngnathoides biaculeatus TaxID=300417 RepID=UPI002ADDCD21|nr:uncharacterized protein LOC133512865 [Syngnathoides biaculeatus]XP_061698856.1 uncharacterized protein LOC133512865 [Syngnathoides biaculeatus]